MPHVLKSVGRRHYVHADAFEFLPREVSEKIAAAEKLAHVRRTQHFNVARFEDLNDRISLLNYPHFFEDGFPALHESWLVDLTTGRVSYRTYRDSLTPPILHRKELMLAEDHPRRAEFQAHWWPDPQMEPEFLRCLGEVGDAAGTILRRKLGRAMKFVPHHLAHAASAYYPSGFDPAAILVIDGIGEAACSTLARGEGSRIETIETFSYPHSLGFLWEQASIYLGFSMYDAAKVMGLAAYGDPDVYRQQLASVIQVSEESYEVDLRALGFPSFDAPGFEPLLGPSRKEEEEILPRHMDFAATLQEVTDAAVVALLRRLERSVKADRLCVAGGVALNCVTNELIRKASSFSEIFIPSAPHDAGTAIGAALAVYCAERRTKPPPSGATPYLGPQFDERAVMAAIRAAGLTPRRTKSAGRDAADMIADGNIVGWFQGRMEFGPRALGNRSLLADPRRPDTRPILNRMVKHREDFRPFAPSVLAERADEWFEVGPHLASHEYMLFACPTKAGRGERIPAVIHHDGTARHGCNSCGARPTRASMS